MQTPLIRLLSAAGALALALPAFAQEAPPEGKRGGTVFSHIIAEQGVAASELLVVTFTRAATSELRARIRARLASGEDPQRLSAVLDLVEDSVRQR